MLFIWDWRIRCNCIKDACDEHLWNSEYETQIYKIAELFILKKIRLSGIGKSIAIRVFELHKGQWEVFQRNSNKPAQLFWRKVINEYSGGKFSEHTEDGKQIQRFVSL